MYEVMSGQEVVVEAALAEKARGTMLEPPLEPPLLKEPPPPPP
jgi:hypothetical protein